MIYTVASYKGGVGKTVTAIHLAAALSAVGKTMLVDSDENRSAIKWAQRGAGFGFPVVSPMQTTRYPGCEFVVYDTGQRPRDTQLAANAAECDMLVVPTEVAEDCADVLVLMIEALTSIKAQNYSVLFTRVPWQRRERAVTMRKQLVDAGVRVFNTEIPSSESFEHASAAGVPVRDLRDRLAKRAWAAYSALGKELLA